MPTMMAGMRMLLPGVVGVVGSEGGSAFGGEGKPLAVASDAREGRRRGLVGSCSTPLSGLDPGRAAVAAAEGGAGTEGKR